MDTPTPAPSSTFSRGQVLSDRFRIERLIAAGGMGEVYEATDLTLQERIALKTVRSEIARDESAIEQFMREVHLARKVTHPNVCRIFDVFFHHPATSDSGEVDPPTAFVTMELLPGETLAQRLDREGRMDPAEALPLIRQMASALDAAHQAGILYCLTEGNCN